MVNGKKLVLALALVAALLTLSGCDGTQGGTIDYIEGHWVFTDAQTEQSTDVTQLLFSPDAFYAAACAMGDEELRSCFDLLTSGQCAELFRSLGEERAMALAGRLTQPQVERLLSALQGQEKVQGLTDPAALAAVWQTLTTDEQLMALSGLSSEAYATLWALLEGTTPSPSPDEALPEATAAPGVTDPAYLASIWHTLTQQEQADVLSGLSSAQFVALWSLLDEQGSAASGEATPAPSDGEADAQQTPAPQTETLQPAEMPDGAFGETENDGAGGQMPGPQESTSEEEPETTDDPEADRTPVPEITDPAALAEIWFGMTPEEQLDAIRRLTAEQFAALQELLAARPRPTPVEEDIVFVPSPAPTVRPTPAPPAALPASGDSGVPEETEQLEETERPVETEQLEETERPVETEQTVETERPEETELPEETEQPEETQTPEPDWSNPAYLAGIWHTLTPKEQLSILSTLTTEQYIALQELLDRMKDEAAGIPSGGEQEDGEGGGKGPAGDEPGAAGTTEPGTPDSGVSAPERGTAAEETKRPEAQDTPVPEGGTAAEETEQPAAADGDLPETEQGTVPTPGASGPQLPNRIAYPGTEATPTEGLPVPGTLSEDSLTALSRLLKSGTP